MEIVRAFYLYAVNKFRLYHLGLTTPSLSPLNKTKWWIKHQVLLQSCSLDDTRIGRVNITQIGNNVCLQGWHVLYHDLWRSNTRASWQLRFEQIGVFEGWYTDIFCITATDAVPIFNIFQFSHFCAKKDYKHSLCPPELYCWQGSKASETAFRPAWDNKTPLKPTMKKPL